MEKNVKNDEWVGANQSGMIGYYHDRTINLDGKVDPEALKANMKNEVVDYILEKKVDYLIDVVGLSTWQEMDKITNNYELIVEDYQKNIAVFKRKGLK